MAGTEEFESNADGLTRDDMVGQFEACPAVEDVAGMDKLAVYVKFSLFSPPAQGQFGRVACEGIAIESFGPGEPLMEPEGDFSSLPGNVVSVIYGRQGPVLPIRLLQGKRWVRNILRAAVPRSLHVLLAEAAKAANGA